MSFRPELKPYQIITNGDLSGNITSLVTIIQKLSLVTYTFSWSGSSPSGTLAMQISNDYSIDAQGNVSNAGNWSALSFNNHGSITPVASITISGNTGTDNMVSDLCGAYAIRVFYSRNSGSGTLQGWIAGKVS